MISLKALAKFKTKPETVTDPLVPGKFVVQSFRGTDGGDTVSMKYTNDDGREVEVEIPPEVATVIARQRRSLDKRS